MTILWSNQIIYIHILMFIEITHEKYIKELVFTKVYNNIIYFILFYNLNIIK